MASGLSSPVGFKNGTDGGLTVAINALQSVAHSHRFLGINSEGRVSVFETKATSMHTSSCVGGAAGPIIHLKPLRSVRHRCKKRSYPSTSWLIAAMRTRERPLSTAGSCREVVRQIAEGNQSIMGLMLESHLEAGNQSIPEDLSALRLGSP